MKHYLAVLICYVSLTGCFSPTSHVPVEPLEYQWGEFYFLEDDKFRDIISEDARAMQDCGLTHREGTPIEWTGGCVAGKRDATAC